MAFANEYISAADIEKYGIKEFDDKNHKAHYEPSWTVDHERDIYLRYVSREHEEFANRHTYAFYWKGTMLMVEVDVNGGGSGEANNGVITRCGACPYPKTSKRMRPKSLPI